MLEKSELPAAGLPRWLNVSLVGFVSLVIALLCGELFSIYQRGTLFFSGSDFTDWYYDGAVDYTRVCVAIPVTFSYVLGCFKGALKGSWPWYIIQLVFISIFLVYSGDDRYHPSFTPFSFSLHLPVSLHSLRIDGYLLAGLALSLLAMKMGSATYANPANWPKKRRLITLVFLLPVLAAFIVFYLGSVRQIGFLYFLLVFVPLFVSGYVAAIVYEAKTAEQIKSCALLTLAPLTICNYAFIFRNAACTLIFFIVDCVRNDLNYNGEIGLSFYMLLNSICMTALCNWVAILGGYASKITYSHHGPESVIKQS